MMSCPSPLENEVLISEPKYFTQEQLSLLNKQMIPQHIAIIPDGNRRWARQQLFRIEEGHRKGADNLITIVRAAKEAGVKNITFYLFSTENWTREPYEVRALMWILENFLVEQRQAMLDGGMRLLTIGELSALPETTIRVVEETKKITAHCDKINLIAALNYGSRDELTRAFKKILNDFEQDKVCKEEINEALIARYLDTSELPDPELLIRTSGEVRVSNFLLWQISYAEIYVANVLWPAFKPSHLLEAILYFQSRDRRLGGGA